MRLVRPGIKFLNVTDDPLQTIERAGRTCYKSEDRVTPDSADCFVHKLLDRGHLAMIEHAWMSYRVVCDRGVTHEIVRHRLFSYAQESTRYCDYGGGVTFVIPPWFPSEFEEGEYETRWNGNGGIDLEPRMSWSVINNRIDTWVAAVASSELRYKYLLESGWSPQEARGMLPNALKTEIVMTGNLREWRHFFTLRCSVSAGNAPHPQMREVADMILADARGRVVVVFEDLGKGD